MILIDNPVSSTVIFTLILSICILFSLRKKTDISIFPKELTEELKGFAILVIVFSHIGYILSSTDRFLWPLSILAGVGVNLFLFLSGYGLTISGMKKTPTLKSRAKRMLNIFIPLWIVLVIYFLADYFILDITYMPTYIAHSFAGFFLRADAFLDVNSVLWYFTAVLFYYVMFYLVFMPKRVWASALIIFLLGTAIVSLDYEQLKDVMRFYQIHTIAFPLGMLIAWFSVTKFPANVSRLRLGYSKAIQSVNRTSIKGSVLYVGSMITLVFSIGYFAINSGVDGSIVTEQLISLLTMFLIVIFFIIKKFRIGLLSLFGFVSFEIYLLHWPLISRYDFLYNNLPAWLATALYLMIFVGLGWLLKRIVGFRFKRSS